jgi:alkylation response protein AidB-like acyl-CoA dehydrogenase
MPQALKVEEFAAVDGGLMLLLSAHALGVAPVLLGGDLGQLRRVLLPAFRESERGAPHLFAYAITEPGGGSDVEDAHGAATHRPGVTARRVDGGWRLSGTKCYISGGDIAQTIVVFAALEGEGMASWTAFIVRRGDAGLRISRTEHKLGMRASGAAEVQLDEVFVADADVVGGVRRGWALNRATLNLSRIPVGAMGDRGRRGLRVPFSPRRPTARRLPRDPARARGDARADPRRAGDGVGGCTSDTGATG